MLKENWNNAMEGQIELLDERPVLTAEIEEWKHGCCIPNIISAQGLGDLLNKLRQLTPNDSSIHKVICLVEPSGGFIHDDGSYIEPIHWRNPQQNEILVSQGWLKIILYTLLMMMYICHINEQWTECVKGN